MNQQHLQPGLSHGQVGATSPLAAGASPTAGSWPQTPQATHAYVQTEGVTLEWRITGLKGIFDQTRGETKSRVVKSALFGGGRWQILWYPNAGGPAGSEWTSLYLSCEPLPEEFLSLPASSAPSAGSPASAPAFERKGVYRFKFSITAGDKLIAAKEDKGHEFRTECGNWGWQSFQRRDTLIDAVRRLDAFTITCEVTSQPEPPRLPDPVPRTLLPTDLVNTIGCLLDQESYSDVEFIIAPRCAPSAGTGRTIWANRMLLAARAEYYGTMFSAGFAEDLGAGVASLALADDGASTAEGLSTGLPELADSDRSDAGESSDESDDDGDEDEDDGEQHGVSTLSPTLTPSSLLSSPGSGRDEEQPSTAAPHGAGLSNDDDSASGKVSTSARQARTAEPARRARAGPRKASVVIRDASYPTYFALLYFLYTETITFAPLTSSFLRAATTAATDVSSTGPDESLSHRRPTHVPQSSTSSSYRSFVSSSPHAGPAPSSNPQRGAVRLRAEWIDSWVKAHPGKPRPASAKSLFVLADKMGLGVLRAKAFRFIVDSLSVETIAYEAFTDLAAAYDDLRKVHVDFMLLNWERIRQTQALNAIWSELRSGLAQPSTSTSGGGRRRQHAGFEAVWPLVVGQLEYVPRPLGLEATGGPTAAAGGTAGHAAGGFNGGGGGGGGHGWGGGGGAGRPLSSVADGGGLAGGAAGGQTVDLWPPAA